MTDRCLVHQTTANNINIWNVSHVTLVTSMQPLSVIIRLQLAKPGCGWPSCIINVPNTATRLIGRPHLESGCGYTPCLKKNVPPLACYNCDAHEWILIFFGGNVTDKVGNQKTLYYATSNNLCFCTTWQNAETRNHIYHWIKLCYTHNAPVRYLPERKNCHLWCVW